MTAYPRGPRPARWISAALLDWAGVAATLAFAHAYGMQGAGGVGWAALATSLLLLGGFQHRLGILGHDGAHRLISRHRRLNDALACILSLWPVMMSLDGYRRFHFSHHREVGTDADPERIHTRSKWLGQWRRPMRPPVVTAQLAGDLMGGGVPHVAMAARLTSPDSPLSMAGPVLMALTGTALWVAAGLWFVPALWFLALGTTFWFWFRLRMWTEHVVDDAAGDPTLRIHAPLWARLFIVPHNTWCHWEHHEDPNVALSDLPAMRRATQGPPILTARELITHLRGNP